MPTLVDKERFLKRTAKIYTFWTEGKHDLLNKVDGIAVGRGTEDSPYSKSQTVQILLFGYELADTLMLLCKNAIYFLASKKKVDFLKPLESESGQKGVPPVHCLVRDKEDKDEANFAKLLSAVKQSGNGNVVGRFAKEKHDGEFMKAWTESLKKSELETMDVTIPFSLILATKDELETGFVKQACNATCALWIKYLRKQIIDIVDAEKKVRHEKIADGCEEALQDRKVVGGIDTSHLEICFAPIIQSGGNYSLKFSASSDKKPLHFGAIVCTFGARYKYYCSALSRTMLVDPSEGLQQAYEILLEAEEKVIQGLQPGATLSKAYEAGLAVVQQAKNADDLLPKLTKTFGFATGIEFRENGLVIGPKNTEKMEEGMVFAVHLGLSDLNNSAAKDDAGKVAALAVGDTVVITNDGPVCLTEPAKKRFKSIAIMLAKDGDEEKEEDNKENIEEALGRGKRSGVVLNDKMRKKETNEDKRKLHQKELAEHLNATAKERLSKAKNQVAEAKVKKSNVSYKSFNNLPQDKEVRSLQIFVDKKYETVILPIFGVPVPFHISMIKNISQSVEGDFTYLRVNFFHPGSIIGKENNMFPNPLATFVKEMTYRSSNLKEPGELNAPSSNLNTAFRLIKEVQKRFKTREAEEREKEGVVKQDKLVLSQNKGNPRLKDLYIRPNIVSKRVAGTLEAHVNGFRYTSLRGDKVDILYNNIKHAFFQPCDHEMIILLHFHLKHAILFGKKKHRDIQLFTEVGEITTDLGKYHHMQDRDDVYAEQAERELRHKLNLAFKNFCEKVEKLTNQGVEFDTPFRELGFTGVPFRSSVLLQPTSGSLVNLTEWPPFVVTLDEVELVHFERVSFQLKNFDMVFIHKDYNQKPDMVQQVPMNMLDHVKEWLDSCDIRYTEGIQSLNWPKIMKTIVDDPDLFFQDGGWNFLSTDSDGENSNAEQDSDSEDEDAYVPTEEEDEEEASSEDEDEESPEPTSESGSEGSSDGDEEEEGKDWEQLEAEAKKADLEKLVYDDDDRDSRKRKVPSSSRSKAPPPKKRK